MSNLEIDATSILTGRYFYLAMTTCALWDHIINFDQEVECIWKRGRRGKTLRNLLPKVNTSLRRYTMEGVLILNSIVLCGFSTNIRVFSCKTYTWVSAIVGTALGVITQFMLIMRLYASWDNEGKRIKYIVMTVTVVASLLVIAFLVVYVIKFQDKIIFLPILGSCVPVGIIRMPRALTCAYATVFVFHCLILGLVIYKASEMPRRTNIEVLYRLQVDGFKAFMLLFFANVVSLGFAFNGNPKYQPYSSGLLLSLLTIVNSRIQIRMEALKDYTPPTIEKLWLVKTVQ
ncbi:hypothetical protein BDQ17DRAFT_1411378 [Cyathus striatus]|nr:hypothetical protein BDQ17DRAFT_1411378 [Cyathus striatus]